MGLLSPLNLLYGLSLVALAIIYFRSRSRPILEVPSLLLFEEQPAPIAGAARFWTDLLFWLEAITLATLVLAAAGLYLNATVSGDHAKRHVLVFDTAAGMAALERSGTRLDIAKREALKILDGGSEGEQYQVVEFAAQARTIPPATAGRDSIRRAILSLKTESVAMEPAAFDAAMMAARDADLIEVFADRLPKSLLNADFAGRIRFHQVGITDANAAIVELTTGTVRAEQGRCVVRNFSARPRLCQLEITNDGSLVDKAALMLSPRAQAVHRFGPLISGGLIEARLTDGDALIDDNSRYAYAPADLPVKVAVISPDEAVRDELARVLLAVNENFVITAVDPAHSQELVDPQRSQWALIVMHDWFDSGLTGRARLIIFPRPESGFALGQAAPAGQIREVSLSLDSNDEFAAGLSELGAPVAVGATRILQLSDAMEVLASGNVRGITDSIPMAAIGHDGGGGVGVIGFDIRGDLLMDPDRTEPLLIAIKLIKQLSAPPELQIIQTGKFATLTLGGPSIITAPDGSRSMLTPQAGIARFRPTQAGLYKISGPGSLRRVYANYYDAGESDIRVHAVSEAARRTLLHRTGAPSRTARALGLTPMLVGIATVAVLIESILLARTAVLKGSYRV